MKLLSSFKKELILATRSFYFYVEILFAVILLAVLLFAIPEKVVAVEDEFLFLDMPQTAAYNLREHLLEGDPDRNGEQVTLKVGDEHYTAILIANESQNLYLLDSEEAVRDLADAERKLGVVISLTQENQLHYKYFMQGYETQRLKNLLSILHNADSELLEQRMAEQNVVYLSSDNNTLNDKENTIPPMLAFNSSLMGMFVMAAYVFLDKKEGVITAYAVTASSVKHYLTSKILISLLTGAFSTLIITLPIIGLQINYALLLMLQLTSGFFAAVVGLLLASAYKDVADAFGAIFAIMIVMMLPGMSYFLPGWSPFWVKLIPSYPLITGFREILLPNGNAAYALLTSAGFLAAGYLLFLVTDIRFKKTLGV